MNDKRLLIFIAGLALCGATSWSVGHSVASPWAVDLTLQPTTAGQVSVTWKRTDGFGAIIRQSFPVLEGVLQNQTLVRFTPNKEYAFTVSIDATVYGTQVFKTRSSGHPELDADVAWAEQMGVSQTPTFELAVVDHPGLGAVAIDHQGWVVWSSTRVGGAWDQLPNMDIVSLEDFQTGKDTKNKHGVQQTGVLNQAILSQQVNGLSHEARVDPTDLSVLTVQETARNFTGLENQQVGNKLVKWNRQTGAVTTIADLFDYFDPVKDRGLCSDSSSSHQGPQGLCGPPTLAQPPQDPQWAPAVGDDWSHANSAAWGNQNNYIMSVRHLSAVVSFHANGSGLDWILSSEVNSSKFPDALHFTYDSPASMQHSQHCARQLPNGNVLVFDNGDTRLPLSAPRFSRLVEYQLNRDTKVAKLVWEFRPMLDTTTNAYSFHAGSVARLSSGNTLGGFVCDNDQAGSNCTHMLYEANPEGKEVARFRIPLAVKTAPGERLMGYRGLPLDSIGGERRLSPFDNGSF